MKSIGVTEFKVHCLALLEDIARSGESLLVTKRGRALARVVPSGEGGSVYPQDSLAGTVTILGDVTGPILPSSAWSAFRGELIAPPARASAPATRKSSKKRRRA